MVYVMQLDLLAKVVQGPGLLEAMDEFHKELHAVPEESTPEGRDRQALMRTLGVA